MTAENWSVQASYKTPQGHLINVRAADVDELEALLLQLPHQAIAEAGANLTAVANAAPLVNVQAPPAPQEDIPPTSAPVAAAQNVTPIGVRTTTDRFGNSYEWGLNDAPSCQHGPMPRKTGRAKNGSTFQTWICAQAQGAAQQPPYLKRDDQCPPVWI